MFKALEDMNMITQEDGSINDESLFEAHCDISDDQDEVSQLNELNDSIENMEHLHDTIATYGVTESLLSFSNKDKILTSAFPAFAACEALDGDAAADSPQAANVKKSLLSKIKDTSAAWFKKAWDMVSGWGGKILSFAKAIYTKTQDALKWVGGKVYNVAKAAKDVITAHPIESVLAVMAAVAGTVYIASIWELPLPENEQAFNDRLKNISERMKKSNPEAAAYQRSKMFSKKTALAAGLGYTKEAFEKIVNESKNLFGENGGFAKMGKFFSEKVSGIFNSLKNLNGDSFKWGRKYLNKLVSMTWKMIHESIASVGSMITSALSVFKKFFTGKNEGSSSSDVPNKQSATA